MRTRFLRIAALAAAVLAPAFIQVWADADPWWQTDTYTPADTRIESIPVADIDKTWTKASPLTPALLSNDARAYYKEFSNEPSVRASAFDAAGDFNRDGKPDRAVVGVYRTRSGETGRFVLVLTQTPAGWSKVFVDTMPGKAGFSTLVWQDGRLLWRTCFECDVASEISWEKDHYETDDASGPDVEE